LHAGGVRDSMLQRKPHKPHAVDKDCIWCTICTELRVNGFPRLEIRFPAKKENGRTVYTRLDGSFDGPLSGSSLHSAHASPHSSASIELPFSPSIPRPFQCFNPKTPAISMISIGPQKSPVISTFRPQNFNHDPGTSRPFRTSNWIFQKFPAHQIPGERLTLSTHLP
jgi:hypothetical protein